MTADGASQPPGSAPRPLDGMLVVTLEQAVAAPFATRQLADLGARVIKIERPGRGDFARDYDSAAGDGMSSWFVWLNRSKESVVLDLKTASGRRGWTHSSPGPTCSSAISLLAAIARLGLDASQLSARHPRLVACQLSGYGDHGPYADRKAYDLLVQAEAGVLAVTGPPAEPAKVGISVADIAGGMYAYSGILTALLQRERTSHGGVVRTSLFGALAEWMSHPMLLATLTGSPPARNGSRHATIVPYGSYLTADGGEILLAVQNETEWARLCRDVLDLPELAADARYAGNQRRVERRDEVEDLLAQAAARLTAAELVRSAGGGAGRLRRGAGGRRSRGPPAAHRPVGAGQRGRAPGADAAAAGHAQRVRPGARAGAAARRAHRCRARRARGRG